MLKIDISQLNFNDFFESLLLNIIFLGVECGKPTYFTIDTRGAGKAKPEVQFKPARGSYRPPARKAEIVDNNVSDENKMILEKTFNCIHEPCSSLVNMELRRGRISQMSSLRSI